MTLKERLQAYASFLFFSLLGFLILYVLYPYIGKDAQLFHEALTNYYYNAQNFGFFDQLMKTDNGYLSVFPRLVSGMVAFYDVPTALHAKAYNLTSLAFIAVFSATVFLPFSVSFLKQYYQRVLFFLCLIFTQDHEMFTFINFPYYSLVPLVLVIVSILEEKKFIGNVFTHTLLSLYLALLICSKIYFLVLAPVFIVLFYRYALRKINVVLFSLPIVLSCFLQAYTVVLSNVNEATYYAKSTSYAFYFVPLIVSIVLAAGIGINAKIAKGLFVGFALGLMDKNFRLKLKDLFFSLNWKKITFTVPFAMLFIAVAIITLNIFPKLYVHILKNNEVLMHRNWFFATLPVFTMFFWMITRYQGQLKSYKAIFLILFCFASYPIGFSEYLIKSGRYAIPNVMGNYRVPYKLLYSTANFEAFAQDGVPGCIGAPYPLVMNCKYIVSPPHAMSFYNASYVLQENFLYEFPKKVVESNVRFIGIKLLGNSKDVQMIAHSIEGNEFELKQLKTLKEGLQFFSLGSNTKGIKAVSFKLNGAEVQFKGYSEENPIFLYLEQN